MTAGIASLCILLFVVAFARSGLVNVAREVIAIARKAVSAVRNPTLDDLARERIARQGALGLIRAAAQMLGRGLLVLSLSALPLVFASLAGLVETKEVLLFLARFDVMLAASALIVFVLVAWRWQARRR